MERRLAAMMAADVVDYSRLLGDDEAGTLERLKSLRTDLVLPSIARHKGRVVKLMGDGLLAEFQSVVEAVKCAIEIQEHMAGLNADAPDARRIRMRIGVHLGDIIVEGADIYGDGVNVTSRLEGLAEPGGVCISSVVHESLGNRIGATFADAGEQRVKNIARPVQVWHWVPRAAAPGGRGGIERPSIAVLPFTNMSGDPEQSYLADGIAEDILTGLARVRWLVVTSRNSSFAFRGQHSDLRRIARDLGVRYVLEGSVRRAGARVRVTAQLIDAGADRHLWAERYDRNMEDIFDLQDEITATILGAIEPELGVAEQERARRKPPESLDAWDYYLRGQWHLFRYTPEDNATARDCFRQAIKLDPEFPASHAGLAYACHLAIIENFSDDPAASVAEGVKAARRAISLDDKDAMAHSVLARILTMNRDYDAAMLAGKTAIELNPNNAQVRFGCALALSVGGQPEEALAQLEEATRLSPHDPNIWSFMVVRAWSLGLLGRFEEAADWARRAAAQPNSVLWPNAILASVLGHLGRWEEARAVLQSLGNEFSENDLAKVWEILPFRDPAHTALMIEGIRKALAE